MRKKSAPCLITKQGRFFLVRKNTPDIPMARYAAGRLTPPPDIASIVKDVLHAKLEERRGNQRLLLRIVPAEQPATGDFFVRVFVGLPSAGPNTSPDVPQYAGSFAFFNDPDAHGHHGAAGTESNAAFVVDVGATLEKLRASGATVSGALDVNLVVVPQSGLDSRARMLRVRSLELQLAESSTPAPRPLGAPAVR